MSDSIPKQCRTRQRMGFSLDAGRALRIGLWCGLAGVLVDIDHIIFWIVQYFSKGELSYTGRFLHSPLLIASGIVLLSCGAYLGGFFFKCVLKKKL